MATERKSGELKELTGNPGRRAIPATDYNRSDISKKRLGTAPKSLKDTVAGERWAQIRKDCPWLREADSTAVELLCRSWERLQETEVPPSVVTSLTKQINEILWNLGASGYSSRKTLELAQDDEKKHPANSFD